MISEQDFILNIRRLNRLQTPQTVLHLPRPLAKAGAIYAGAAYHFTAGLQAFAQERGALHVMGNGDGFCIMPPLSDDAIAVLMAGWREKILSVMPDDAEPWYRIYQLPQDYAALREHANSYIALAQAREVMGPLQQAEAALSSQTASGALTAYSLAQVETLLENMDIRPYVRIQPIYSLLSDKTWHKQTLDVYVGLADLKRERFPRLNLAAPERLFLECCCTLDRKLLLEFAGRADYWLAHAADKQLSFNLAAETVLSGAFGQFCRVLPKPQRGKIRFDLHFSALFIHFATTLNALRLLRGEGFAASIDCIPPAVLPYIGFQLLPVDYLKINVSRETWPEMQDAAVLKALHALPPENIIFSHCDHEAALDLGKRLAIRHYQGWLIDDKAG